MNKTEKFTGRKKGRHIQNTHSVVTPSDSTFSAVVSQPLTTFNVVQLDRSNNSSRSHSAIYANGEHILAADNIRCDRYYAVGEDVVATARKVVVEPGRRLEKQRYTQLELEAHGWRNQASWDKQEGDGRKCHPTWQGEEVWKKEEIRRNGKAEAEVERKPAVHTVRSANCIYSEQPEQCANT